jgi:hypothetical protein
MDDDKYETTNRAIFAKDIKPNILKNDASFNEWRDNKKASSSMISDRGLHDWREL